MTADLAMWLLLAFCIVAGLVLAAVVVEEWWYERRRQTVRIESQRTPRLPGRHRGLPRSMGSLRRVGPIRTSRPAEPPTAGLTVIDGDGGDDQCAAA